MMRNPGPSRCPANHGATYMNKIALSLAVLAAILLPALSTAPAHAVTSIHTWVSHNGSDSNPCTLALPCQTLTQALSQVSFGGVVSCLDSGAFGTYTVTISVTIDCSGTVATPDTTSTFGCTSAITVNAPGDVVILRGLTLTSYASCPASGISIQAASAVYIEDCVVQNFPLQGIVDARTSGLTKLTIKNTIVRNNAGAGIVAAAASKNSVVLENVQSVGNSYGIGVGTGNNVVISRSVMSENSNTGIEADAGAQVYVENTKISHNGIGVLPAGTVVLANSDITFNSISTFGAATSYGNNRLFGNGPGLPLTPAGPTSTDFGQQ
jgi:hypothetical protein